MKDKFTIIRDTREKPNHGWSFAPSSYCNGTVIDKVYAGDYTIKGLEDYICIERKQSIDEFANNCVSKRWKKCMYKMEKCKFKFLLFEFSWRDIDNYPRSSKAPQRIKDKLRVPAKYIRKVINTARNDFNIHVLACNDKYFAEVVAYKILKKSYNLYIKEK